MIAGILISQEIFAIDVLISLKFSLEQRRKNVLRSFRLYGDQALKPGLHIVLTMAEHASDDASKRILKLSTNQLQIFLVKY